MFARLTHLTQRILTFLDKVCRHQSQNQSGVLSTIVTIQWQLPSVLLLLSSTHFLLKEQLALNLGSSLCRSVLLNVYDSNVNFEETRLIALVLELEKKFVTLDMLRMGKNVRC